MKRLAANATNFFLQFGFYITALRPLPRLPMLSLIYRLCWLTTLLGLIFLMFHARMYGGDVSIAGLVGTALFVSKAAVYTVCIVEVICKQGKYRRLRRLQREVDAIIARHLRGVADVKIQRVSVLLQLLPLLILLYGCDGFKVWIHKRSFISPVFWHSMFVTQGLRMRVIEIVLHIMDANQRVALLKQSLQHMVRHNQPKSKYGSDIWLPYAAWEYDQLNVQRLIYGRIFEIYLALNECFGWSILSIFLTSFFDFVCNAFWSFAAAQSFEAFDKFAFNGSTSFGLGVLVSMLFWSTEVSHGNNATLKHFKHSMLTSAITTHSRFTAMIGRGGDFGFLSSSRSCLVRCAYNLLYVGLWIFALAPYFTARPGLNELYSCLWILEIIAVTLLACYYHLPKDQLSLVGMVTLILFLTQMIAHMVILIDAWAMKHERAMVYQRFARIDLHIRVGKRKPKEQDQKVEEERKEVDDEALAWYLARQILMITALLALCHLVISWSTAQMSGDNGVALYWYSLPSALALQFKILEFFSGIVCLNRRLEAVRRRLNDKGERNFCTLTRPCLNMRQWLEVRDEQSEGVLQLDELKMEYSELYVVFRLFNDCYGWSLLAFAAMYFTDFVCNSFWVCLVVLTQGSQEQYSLVRSAGFVLIVLVLLSVLCWHCQQSSDHSRHIGCIIFKLVKPMGNKRYNDLLSEFSLQVLHQQFVITAKEFFNLNLNLLGSMVAAIVTYLVILIQFMMSEKSNRENSLTTPEIFNDTINTIN